MSNIVQIQGLTRRFREKVALNNVSLNIGKGRVLGIIGENGAGKTTLIKHILGLLRPDEGTVRVFGLDPVKDPAGVLGRIGYLAEEDWLPNWMRVSELQRYYQGFYSGWDQEYAEQLRERFGLGLHSRLRELSKGQRARVGLMAALAYRPELLVFDEPSSGLDPIVRREILTSIIRAVADDNRTVLFSSHLLSEVEQIADDVAMIKDGQFLFCDTMEEVKLSHRRVVLRFTAKKDSPPSFDNTYNWEGGGREWACLYAGKIPTLEAAAALAGAEIVDQHGLNLDEIFVARSVGEAQHV